MKERLLDDLPERFDGWLWKDEKVIPRNEITGLVGWDGHGKTQFALMLTAMLTRGELSGKPEKVFLAMREDGDAITRARLTEYGAEPWLCSFQPQKSVESEGYWTFPSDLEAFEEYASSTDINVAIFDSLDFHLDSVAGQKGRQTLGKLHRIIQKHSITTIFVGHFNKTGREIDTAIGGGRGIKGTFRCTLVWGEKPQMYMANPPKPEEGDDEALERYEQAQAALEDFQDATHVLAVHKNSYGKKYPMKLSMLYQAVERTHPSDPDESLLTFDRVTEWLVSPQHVFRPPPGMGGNAQGGQTLRGNCKELMLQILLVAGDWMPAEELNSILDKAEFSHDTRQKARRELQSEGLIERKKEGRVGWQWRAIKLDLPTLPE